MISGAPATTAIRPFSVNSTGSAQLPSGASDTLNAFPRYGLIRAVCIIDDGEGTQSRQIRVCPDTRPCLHTHKPRVQPTPTTRRSSGPKHAGAGPGRRGFLSLSVSMDGMHEQEFITADCGISLASLWNSLLNQSQSRQNSQRIRGGRGSAETRIRRIYIAEISTQGFVCRMQLDFCYPEPYLTFG